MMTTSSSSNASWSTSSTVTCKLSLRILQGSLPSSYQVHSLPFLGSWKLGWATLLYHLWDGEQEGLELDVGVQDSELVISQASGDGQCS